MSHSAPPHGGAFLFWYAIRPTLTNPLIYAIILPKPTASPPHPLRSELGQAVSPPPRARGSAVALSLGSRARVRPTLGSSGSRGRSFRGPSFGLVG